jgi:hypothetical protein
MGPSLNHHGSRLEPAKRVYVPPVQSGFANHPIKKKKLFQLCGKFLRLLVAWILFGVMSVICVAFWRNLCNLWLIDPILRKCKKTGKNCDFLRPN